MTSKMSIQGLLPKEREYWFPESRRHILTIVLVKTMFIMWRRFQKLDLQCFSYLTVEIGHDSKYQLVTIFRPRLTFCVVPVCGKKYVGETSLKVSTRWSAWSVCIIDAFCETKIAKFYFS